MAQLHVIDVCVFFYVNSVPLPLLNYYNIIEVKLVSSLNPVMAEHYIKNCNNISPKGQVWRVLPT